MYLKVKRILDVSFGLIAFFVLLPVLLLSALAIKLDSKGPVLFFQDRLGKNGKVFRMCKFRSMIVNAEKQGTGVYSGKGDSRVTRAGRVMRAASIDELPQIFNILRGDMSFIGPRPPLTYHPWPIEEYTDEQKSMFRVRPGISGWAQVNGRKTVEWYRRIGMNCFYVENISFILDVRIFFMTFFKILRLESNANTTPTVVHNITADIPAEEHNFEIAAEIEKIEKKDEVKF
jgi:lipopolysaccharide/colanic/teichoic acid biosynthesis glycosyltransferase